MQHHIINTETGALFYLSDFDNSDYQSLLSSSALYKILFNTGETGSVYIDNSFRTIKSGEMVFCKPLNAVHINNPHNDIKVIAFNKAFYKLSTKEEEEAFYWFWYHAVSHPRSFTLSALENSFFKMMYDCMEREFDYTKSCKDTIRDSLKRIIAISTAKTVSKDNSPVLGDIELNAIKKFNFLTEEHFRNKVLFADISKLFYKPTPYLNRLFNKYFTKQTPLNVKQKIMEKSQEAVERIEKGIELQYNSRLNIIRKIEHQSN